jgi:hypothetical protein
MTNRSPPSPRFFFRSVRNARQKTSSSESPTSRPRDDRDLAAAVSGDPGGDDHGHRDDLGGGVADVQVGRVEIDVGDSVWSSRRVRNAVTTSSSPAQIRDTSDLEMPESTPRADQIVDRPGRDTADVGLHHHRIERLVDPAAGLEDDREERPLPQLRDPRLDVAGLGR